MGHHVVFRNLRFWILLNYTQIDIQPIGGNCYMILSSVEFFSWKIKCIIVKDRE